MVVEKLIGENYAMELIVGNKARCMIAKRRHTNYANIEANTAPLAISLAALASCGVKDE